MSVKRYLAVATFGHAPFGHAQDVRIEQERENWFQTGPERPICNDKGVMYSPNSCVLWMRRDVECDI